MLEGSLRKTANQVSRTGQLVDTTTNLDPSLRVRALLFSRLVAKARNYLALTKPRVMSLVVFTAVVTLVLAPGHVAPIVGVATIVCITIGAGAASALNMWYDADVDALMTRTAARPIPVGRVSAEAALAFGLVMAAISVLALGAMTNVAAAGLLAFTIFFYVVVYTAWLKRSTPQSIVIGGAAGASSWSSGHHRISGPCPSTVQATIDERGFRPFQPSQGRAKRQDRYLSIHYCCCQSRCCPGCLALSPRSTQPSRLQAALPCLCSRCACGEAASREERLPISCSHSRFVT
jgi:hypothetical protein